MFTPVLICFVDNRPSDDVKLPAEHNRIYHKMDPHQKVVGRNEKFGQGVGPNGPYSRDLRTTNIIYANKINPPTRNMVTKPGVLTIRQYAVRFCLAA